MFDTIKLIDEAIEDILFINAETNNSVDRQAELEFLYKEKQKLLTDKRLLAKFKTK